MEKFNPTKLNELEVRKEYQIKITNTFAALETLSDSEDVNRAWENVKGNIKISAKKSIVLYKLKRQKHGLMKKCLCLLAERKRAKCSGCRIQTKAM